MEVSIKALKLDPHLPVSVRTQGGTLGLTLSDIVPDVQLQVFHDTAHLSGELLLFASVNQHHRWGSKPSG